MLETYDQKIHTTSYVGFFQGNLIDQSINQLSSQNMLNIFQSINQSNQKSEYAEKKFLSVLN